MATSGHRHRHRYFSGEPDPPPPAYPPLEFTEFDLWNASPSPELRKTVTKKPSSSPATENRTAVRMCTAPVDVPDWSVILKQEVTENGKSGYNYDDFDEDVYGAGDLIPPHEYLARGKVTSFSVHEGFGRTLKGRDLSRVRNAVWKKIGFED